jgi:DNA polymerase-3 subunit beta
MPILSSILLVAQDDELQLVATDLEIGIRTSIPALVGEGGQVALPARLLGEIVGSLPPEAVEIRVEEGSHVEILCGRAQFAIQGLPASDFPKCPVSEGETICEVSTQALRTLIRSTIFAVSTDETRPFLTGVYLVSREGELVAVATDGGRLALRKARAQRVMRAWSGIVPAKAMNELHRLLGGLEATVPLQLVDGQLLVRCDKTQLWSRLISGTFPNYEQVIPKEFCLRLRVATDSLRAATRRVAITARDSASVVRLVPQDGILVLESNTPEVGRAREELAVQMEGTPVEVAFNARYLLEALGVIEAEEVTFDLTGPLSPAKLGPSGSEDYVYVLAPVRVYG